MIREMRPGDWERVAEIYTMGLEGGISTFNTVCPAYDTWDTGHHKDCRLVYEENGRVIGWTALSPTSARPVYRGVAEVSIYIDRAYHGRGIGTALMTELVSAARAAGYWSLYSSIFSINKASIALHLKCGFREVGYRERISKDRFGQWQNTTIMELRLPD